MDGDILRGIAANGAELQWIACCPASLEVADEQVHIWRIDLAQPGTILNALENLLAEDEKARAHRFHFARDRKRFTVARAALRQILAGCLGVDSHSVRFSTGPYGKPRLVEENLRFNVSHSGELALVAVARNRELGVDIEELRRMDDAEALADRFFSAPESRKLRTAADSASRIRGFFECWSRKEAFIKAIGEGLSHPLDSFEVSFFPDTVVTLRLDSGDSGKWALRNIDPGPGYCGAIVFERNPDGSADPDIHLWEWQPAFWQSS